MDFDIETVSDVLSLLFKLDDQIDMKFEAEKDKDGNFKPATLRMSFKNPMINKKICTYMKALELRENMINSKDDYSEEEVEQFAEVLYTMKPEEVAGWNRSLILRGINLPDQLKDEVISFLSED